MTTPPLIHRAALDTVLAGKLAGLRAENRERTLRTVRRRAGAIVHTQRGEAIDFSSNDYLGLASDRRPADAAARAMAEQGVGGAASRLISGNNPEHEALEDTLAAFFGAERALTFSSGYAANTGIIPALVGRGDAVFSDALNHASLIDGCRLSRADVHVYPHADTRALAELLDRHRGGARHAMIVTDGLFSMDGDFAPLAEIVELAQRFDAWTYVDDAHAAGVVGPDGRGTASDTGCDGLVDVIVGTLGKAFGVGGAFVLGSTTLTQFLVNRARSFVFSTAMSPGMAAAARASIDIVRDEPERRARLAANTARLRAALDAAGIAVIAPPDAPATHIIPVHIGHDARAFVVGDALATKGFLVGAVRPPTVPEGGSRLRITVSAAHTDVDIQRLVAALSSVLAS